MKQMAETCVFCGREGESFPPEHWIPRWISRAVIGKRQRVEIHPYEGEPWYANAFELTVRCVCPDCNHHWMSDVETRTRDIALPLIRGDAKAVLTEDEQAQLASWAFLKVITLELGRPEEHRRTHPDELYSGFRRFRHPPGSSCALSIGRRHIDPDDPRPLYVWFRSQGEKREVPGLGEVDGYRTALVIGHLAIDVIGLHDGRVAIFLEDEDPRLVRIWPPVHPSIDLAVDSFQGIENNELV